jgi:hypothetical protein
VNLGSNYGWGARRFGSKILSPDPIASDDLKTLNGSLPGASDEPNTASPLQVVVEKAAWQDGALRTTLFEPFEILRHSNQESYRKEKENGGSGRDMEVWLWR